MDLQEFLHRVLPPEGTYFAAYNSANKGFNQRAADDINSLSSVITYSIEHDMAAYFATGSFKDNSSRQAKNLYRKKALYLDMDCGVGKEFPSQKDAVVKLFNFCKVARLPKPNLTVNSGNGVHAYWTFDRAVAQKDWVELADILNELCTQHEFPADPVVTSDGARIMRAPGSINKKDPANPKKCVVIGQVRPDYPIEKLQILFRAHRSRPNVPNLPNVDVNDLSNAALAKHEWYAKHIINECPTVKGIKDTGGAGCSEPLWMHTLNLLAFCADGAEYIHPISNKHATYNARMTEQKFNLRLKAKHEERTGPTLCKTFAQYPQAKCATCPHNGEIQSPISLGREPPPPPEELPYPYKQDLRGIYFVVEGERIDVCPYCIDALELQVSPHDKRHSLYVEFHKGGNKKLIRVRIDNMVSSELEKTLLNAGIFIGTDELKKLRHVMISWAQQLQQAAKVNQLSDGFGWDKNNFSAGGMKYTPEKTYPAPIADVVLQEHYTPIGELDKWKESAQYILNTGAPELLPILASAFAAPLISLTGIHGAILSVVSDSSGTGKTSALKIAQAVWGNPIKGINALNDTTNSVSNRMAALRHLPLYWDELRQAKDITDFLTLVFRASQGRDKTRLTKSSEQMHSGDWSTLITAASNEPLKDYVDAVIGSSTDAGMKRIFEVVMKTRISYALDGTSDRLLKQVERNYGHAGNVYAEYLVQHKTEVEEQLLRLTDSVTKKVRATPDERFWLYLIVSLLLGASLAKKLGLVNFD